MKKKQKTKKKPGYSKNCKYSASANVWFMWKNDRGCN